MLRARLLLRGKFRLDGRLIRSQGQRRAYNIGTEVFHKSFEGLPAVDRTSLKNAALTYLESFDPQTWYDDPIRTIVEGKEYVEGGKQVETVNAFTEKNGLQLISSQETVDVICEHLQNFKPSKKDYREAVRKIEAELFNDLAGALIGNQALDFKKQDGITEIEEALEAGAIERRLNDQLFEDEQAGKIEIKRNPAFVGCVSNFSNFLDLSKKVLRNIELGVPVCVLSRNNTTQHMFRWTQLLLNLMAKHGVESGMVTYASCDIPQQQQLFSVLKDSPMYFTGSREIAKTLKGFLPNTMSSTGGPNTLLSTKLNEQVAQAIRTSTLIENSGQCTAMRHVVLPEVETEHLDEIFAKTRVVKDSREAIMTDECAGLFDGQDFKISSGYTQHPTQSVEYKVDSNLPVQIEENWRKASVDVTSVDPAKMKSEEFISSLNSWLIENQPISLAVNGDEDFSLSKRLFEETGLVVYTVGSEDNAALTAQARPQDGEIFGEVPPRSDISKFTKFPIIVPSSTASYNSQYSSDYLTKNAETVLPSSFEFVNPLLNTLTARSKGYAKLLVTYLSEACSTNPKPGYGNRTSLYGLQRPPLDGSETVIRASVASSSDSVILTLLPFIVTNARSQIVLSTDGSHDSFIKESGLDKLVEVRVEDEKEFEANVKSNRPYNVVVPFVEEFPLVSHFVAKLLPLGHIKSTQSDHHEFVEYFKNSDKWLKIATE
eukprot:CAMPEP_0197538412 /NCGR_PEP_ID=MMETSP1318-20131121/59632_1 /TAXON_ID=552666 /ORGANISM="Partenskyella glossopodia, Strain RCC365" /LENGTH=714 /DNA_ID=CAMNT_0043096819 /DNA_START=153 /DNA_END=2297 /DNA_ORIENTATION=+